jgi:hypothetical protein
VAFFGQFQTINSEQIRVTGFCLPSLRILLRKLVKQQKVVKPKRPKRTISSKLEMPAILTKVAKFKAKLLEEEDLSDQELAQMEPKIETELDISMSSISDEEYDGKINLLQYSRRNLRSSLNLSNKTNFSNFSIKFLERRIENTFKNNTKPQGPAKPVNDKKFQIFIEFKTFLKNENFKTKNSQDLPEKDGSNKNQRSNLINNKIRISHAKSKLHRKSICYLIQKLTVFHKIEITDEDCELPVAEMTKEKRDRLDRKLWKKKFPSGIPPFPTPFTPETDAYWREWFAAREARQELEKQIEAEGGFLISRSPRRIRPLPLPPGQLQSQRQLVDVERVTSAQI